MADYWIRQSKNGKIHGPVTGGTLKKLASSGKLKPDDEIGKSGDGPWQTVSKVEGLSVDESNSIDAGLNHTSSGVTTDKHQSEVRTKSSRKLTVLIASVVLTACALIASLFLFGRDEPPDKAVSSRSKIVEAKDVDKTEIAAEQQEKENTNIHNPVTERKPGMAGFQFQVVKDRGLQVVHVYEGTPADLSGISKGDFITIINDIPTNTITSTEEARSLLKNNLFEGTPCLLTIRSPEGNTKTTELIPLLATSPIEISLEIVRVKRRFKSNPNNCDIYFKVSNHSDNIITRFRFRINFYDIDENLLHTSESIALNIAPHNSQEAPVYTDMDEHTLRSIYSIKSPAANLNVLGPDGAPNLLPTHSLTILDPHHLKNKTERFIRDYLFGDILHIALGDSEIDIAATEKMAESLAYIRDIPLSREETFVMKMLSQSHASLFASIVFQQGAETSNKEYETFQNAAAFSDKISDLHNKGYSLHTSRSQVFSKLWSSFSASCHSDVKGDKDIFSEVFTDEINWALSLWDSNQQKWKGKTFKNESGDKDSEITMVNYKELSDQLLVRGTLYAFLADKYIANEYDSQKIREIINETMENRNNNK